jgi:hypothetical protein
MLHGFKIHDAAVAAKAERVLAAREAKAEDQRQVVERKAARLATQPAPQASKGQPVARMEGGRINRRALRRLNGLGSMTADYLAWLDKPKNMPAHLIGKDNA